MPLRYSVITPVSIILLLFDDGSFDDGGGLTAVFVVGGLELFGIRVPTLRLLCRITGWHVQK